MSSQTFTPIEREAIWTAYGKKCYYGEQPLEYKDVEIDHVVPEELLNDSERKTSVFAEYGLPDTFDIQGYGNLVPACSRCNGKKRANLFAKNKMAIILMQTQGKAATIQKEIENRNSTQKLGVHLRWLIDAIDKGHYTKAQLNSAMRNANIIELRLSVAVDLRPDSPPPEVRFSREAMESVRRLPFGVDDIVSSLRSGAAGAHVSRHGSTSLYVVRLRNGVRMFFTQRENVLTILGLHPPGRATPMA